MLFVVAINVDVVGAVSVLIHTITVAVSIVVVVVGTTSPSELINGFFLPLVFLSKNRFWFPE